MLQLVGLLLQRLLPLVVVLVVLVVLLMLLTTLRKQWENRPTRPRSLHRAERASIELCPSPSPSLTATASATAVGIDKLRTTTQHQHHTTTPQQPRSCMLHGKTPAQWAAKLADILHGKIILFAKLADNFTRGDQTKVTVGTKHKNKTLRTHVTTKNDILDTRWARSSLRTHVTTKNDILDTS